MTPVSRVEHGDPWAYVVSANVHRRHLTPSQLAWVGGELATIAHGERGNGRVESPNGDSTGPTRTQAAALVGTNTTGIDRHHIVRKHGVSAPQRPCPHVGALAPARPCDGPQPARATAPDRAHLAGRRAVVLPSGADVGAGARTPARAEDASRAGAARIGSTA